ncbi:hypothetical protein DFJ73DRAFT_821262 [Zopfochytrium polystomum]|nr:hypothetical protein DFJ73DRAFT_821262 [Zopfochytrium polystomum]
MDDGEEDEGVIRCICGFNVDDGFTIQCDRCEVWQHVACMGLQSDQLPDLYLCEECNPRALNVEKAKSIQMRRMGQSSSKPLSRDKDRPLDKAKDREDPIRSRRKELIKPSPKKHRRDALVEVSKVDRETKDAPKSKTKHRSGRDELKTGKTLPMSPPRRKQKELERSGSNHSLTKLKMRGVVTRQSSRSPDPMAPRRSLARRSESVSPQIFDNAFQSEYCYHVNGFNSTEFNLFANQSVEDAIVNAIQLFEKSEITSQVPEADRLVEKMDLNDVVPDVTCNPESSSIIAISESAFYRQLANSYAVADVAAAVRKGSIMGLYCVSPIQPNKIIGEIKGRVVPVDDLNRASQLEDANRADYIFSQIGSSGLFEANQPYSCLLSSIGHPNRVSLLPVMSASLDSSLKLLPPFVYPLPSLQLNGGHLCLDTREECSSDHARFVRHCCKLESDGRRPAACNAVLRCVVVCPDLAAGGFVTDTSFLNNRMRLCIFSTRAVAPGEEIVLGRTVDDCIGYPCVCHEEDESCLTKSTVHKFEAEGLAASETGGLLLPDAAALAADAGQSSEWENELEIDVMDHDDMEEDVGNIDSTCPVLLGGKKAWIRQFIGDNQSSSAVHPASLSPRKRKEKSPTAEVEAPAPKLLKTEMTDQTSVLPDAPSTPTPVAAPVVRKKLTLKDFMRNRGFSAPSNQPAGDQLIMSDRELEPPKSTETVTETVTDEKPSALSSASAVQPSSAGSLLRTKHLEDITPASFGDGYFAPKFPASIATLFKAKSEHQRKSPPPTSVPNPSELPGAFSRNTSALPQRSPPSMQPIPSLLSSLTGPSKALALSEQLSSNKISESQGMFSSFVSPIRATTTPIISSAALDVSTGSLASTLDKLPDRRREEKEASLGPVASSGLPELDVEKSSQPQLQPQVPSESATTTAEFESSPISADKSSLTHAAKLPASGGVSSNLSSPSARPRGGSSSVYASASYTAAETDRLVDRNLDIDRERDRRQPPGTTAPTAAPISQVDSVTSEETSRTPLRAENIDLRPGMASTYPSDFSGSSSTTIYRDRYEWERSRDRDRDYPWDRYDRDSRYIPSSPFGDRDRPYDRFRDRERFDPYLRDRYRDKDRMRDFVDRDRERWARDYDRRDRDPRRNDSRDAPERVEPSRAVKLLDDPKPAGLGGSPYFRETGVPPNMPATRTRSPSPSFGGITKHPSSSLPETAPPHEARTPDHRKISRSEDLVSTADSTKAAAQNLTASSTPTAAPTLSTAPQSGKPFSPSSSAKDPSLQPRILSPDRRRSGFAEADRYPPTSSWDRGSIRDAIRSVPRQSSTHGGGPSPPGGLPPPKGTPLRPLDGPREREKDDKDVRSIFDVAAVSRERERIREDGRFEMIPSSYGFPSARERDRERDESKSIFYTPENRDGREGGRYDDRDRDHHSHPRSIFDAGRERERDETRTSSGYDSWRDRDREDMGRSIFDSWRGDRDRDYPPGRFDPSRDRDREISRSGGFDQRRDDRDRDLRDKPRDLRGDPRDRDRDRDLPLSVGAAFSRRSGSFGSSDWNSRDRERSVVGDRGRAPSGSQSYPFGERDRRYRDGYVPSRDGADSDKGRKGESDDWRGPVRHSSDHPDASSSSDAKQS